MHTHRYPAASRIKMLVFIPVTLACILCCSKNGFSQRSIQKGNIVTYHGNRFEYSETITDTTSTIDSVDGIETIKITINDTYPVKMNRKKIFSLNHVTHKPMPCGGDGTLEQTILNSILDDLNKLADGRYYIALSDIVINKKGRIIFYKYENVRREENKELIDPEIAVSINPKITPGIDQDILRKIDSVLNNFPSFRPGKAHGHHVIALTNTNMYYWKIEIKDHKATYTIPASLKRSAKQ